VLLSAAAFPKRFGQRDRPGGAGGLSRPFHGRLGDRPGRRAGSSAGQPPPDTVVKENEDLRLANLQLTQELVELRRINNIRDNIGPLRDRCTPIAVVGTDSGNREALLLRSGPFSGLRDGMYVLYNQDVIGTLVSGKAGAQVRLITDPQTRVQCGFGTFRNIGGPATQPAAGGATFTRFDLPPRVLVGLGNGKMSCVTIPYADVKRVGLQENDWVILEDESWLPELKGRRVGIVTNVKVSSRMMAEIEVRPERDLLELREVMVLTKEK
jgi:hypothetical protein